MHDPWLDRHPEPAEQREWKTFRFHLRDRRYAKRGPFGDRVTVR